MGWEWTCTVEMRGVLVVERKEEGGGTRRGESGSRPVEYKRMRRVVGLLKEGSDTPRRS